MAQPPRQLDAEPSLFTPVTPAAGAPAAQPVVAPPVVRPPVMRSPVQPPVQPPVLPAPVAADPVPYPPTAYVRGDIDPPTRPVEYLTVRLDPDPVERGFADTTEVPVASMPRMRQAPADDEAQPASGFRRAPAILLGLGVLVVIVTVAVIASVVATGVDSGRTRDAATQASSAAADVVGGTPPDGLTQVPPAKAEVLLAKAGQHPTGDIKQSLSWTDKNGLNLLATVAAPRTAQGTTLTVIQVAGLDGKPRTLRTMVDPNPSQCQGDSQQQAGFTTGSMFVRDLNGDGIAEATIGWSSRCRDGARSQSLAKLALISNGSKFIIRGVGVLGDDGSGDPKPDPVAAKWPKPFRNAATNLYRNLYF